MNETLRRAMLRARLSEEDVAARLQVDPKTVRRWLEGRVPYLRHRWVLAGLLDADEADLWPEVRAALAARSRPAEIKAVYPNRQAMPRQAWLSLFRSAKHEIGILARSGLFLAKEPGVLDVLADRARLERGCGSACGIQTCISLRKTTAVKAQAVPGRRDPRGSRPVRGVTPNRRRDPAAPGRPLQLHLPRRQPAPGHPARLRHPSEREPVLYLRSVAAGDMATTYLDVFERIWAGARSME